MVLDPLTTAVADPIVLKHVWRMVKSAGGGCGIDQQTLEQFQTNLDAELKRILDDLGSGRFRFQRLRAAAIPKADGDKRMLGIPTVRDRIVLQAIRLTLEANCEAQLHDSCHAYRPRRGAETAMRAMADAMGRGLCFVVETDIRKFFDTVGHKPLLKTLQRLVPKFADSTLLLKAIQLGPGRWPAKIGLAQGSPLSPLLANVSLLDFDRAVSTTEIRLVRYADDLILLTRSLRDAELALLAAGKQLAMIGLKLHPDKTRIIDSRTEEFEFLGFRFQPDRILPTVENWTRLHDDLRNLSDPGTDLTWAERIEQINALLRSFACYYQQTDCGRMLWNLDQFVVERLMELEIKNGRTDGSWRGRLVTVHRLREVRYAGKKSQSRRWNGYG